MPTEKVVKASGNWSELYLLAHTQQDESTKQIESISKKELPDSSSLRNLKELIEQQTAGSAASSEELLPMSRAVAEALTMTTNYVNSTEVSIEDFSNSKSQLVSAPKIRGTNNMSNSLNNHPPGKAVYIILNQEGCGGNRFYTANEWVELHADGKAPDVFFYKSDDGTKFGIAIVYKSVVKEPHHYFTERYGCLDKQNLVIYFEEEPLEVKADIGYQSRSKLAFMVLFHPNIKDYNNPKKIAEIDMPSKQKANKKKNRAKKEEEAGITTKAKQKSVFRPMVDIGGVGRAAKGAESGCKKCIEELETGKKSNAKHDKTCPLRSATLAEVLAEGAQSGCKKCIEELETGKKTASSIRYHDNNCPTRGKSLHELKRSTNRKKKHPDAPKQSRGPSHHYHQANKARVKSENPEAKKAEVAKLLTAEYKKLSELELAPWKQAAAEDKKRYTTEMKSYKPPADLEDSDSDSDDDSAPKKKSGGAAKSKGGRKGAKKESESGGVAKSRASVVGKKEQKKPSFLLSGRERHNLAAETSDSSEDEMECFIKKKGGKKSAKKKVLLDLPPTSPPKKQTGRRKRAPSNYSETNINDESGYDPNVDDDTPPRKKRAMEKAKYSMDGENEFNAAGEEPSDDELVHDSDGESD